MRKKLTLFFGLTLLASVLTSAAFAQTTVTGRVMGGDEPLIGAAVTVPGTSLGKNTGIDGSFEIGVPVGSTLSIQYLGYKEYTSVIDRDGKVDLGTIYLEPDVLVISDVTVKSSLAVQRKTPVAVSTIDPTFIEERLGTQEFPELLKSTPSVYATKEGGGYGDSRINVRGFESENTAVMVNGVPVNDMEWGGVYWSNWTGLTDVTRYTQIQRGLGASKIAAPAVGGTINIVTNSIDAERGGSVYYGIGNDGYQKFAFSVSSGLSEKGWAFSLLGSKSSGDGYIDGTAFEAYAWFVNISKQINSRHMLSFTAFGSPQKHDKRYDKLTIEEWKKQPRKYKYNATYGFDDNGQERVGANHNYYHKPQISLNHNWDIDYKSSLSTALYLSIGEGGGYSAQGDSRSTFYGATNGIPNQTYRRSDGTFDYAALKKVNADSDNGSLAAMGTSVNRHVWFGLLSTYTNELTDFLTLQGGLDLRYYKGIHKAKLVDLYGGDYFIDPSRATGWDSGNDNYVNEQLTVGDIVYRDYDGFVTQYGAFGQLEYSQDKLSAFVAVNANNNSYWREERFYLAGVKSETKNKFGWGAKGGANYNFDQHHNAFANVGYFSRTPFYSGGIFLSNQLSNATNPNSKNESVFSYEAGYGYTWRIFQVNINAYRTKWKDKTLVRSVVTGEAESNYINLHGVNALHQGIEVDFRFKPINVLEITGMFSLNDWKWDSNASGYWYNRNGEALDKQSNVTEIGGPNHAQATLNLKDIKVGNSAQTTAALGATWEFLKDLKVGFDGNFYGRNYSNFDISLAAIGSSGVQNFVNPWRIPSAYVFDARLIYNFNIGSIKTTFVANIMNVFNERYITDAQDNGAKTGGHGWQDATVFYGFGRTWSASLKFRF